LATIVALVSILRELGRRACVRTGERAAGRRALALAAALKYPLEILTGAVHRWT